MLRRQQGQPHGIGTERLRQRAAKRLQLKLRRFRRFDYVNCRLTGLAMETSKAVAADTAGLPKPAGRQLHDEHHRPVISWEGLETSPLKLIAPRPSRLAPIPAPLTTVAAPRHGAKPT